MVYSAAVREKRQSEIDFGHLFVTTTPKPSAPRTGGGDVNANVIKVSCPPDTFLIRGKCRTISSG